MSWASVPPTWERSLLEGLAVQCGFKAIPRAPASGGADHLRLSVVLSDDPTLTYDAEHRRLTDECYQLDLADTPRGDNEATATGRRSLRWALADLSRRIERGLWKQGRSREAPAFATRGIIEGFYGNPWSQSARLDMVDFAARNRLNTIMYCPKDDPFQRAEWRDARRDPERERLLGFVKRCLDRDVDSMVGVSPGLSMEYSSTRDNRLLESHVASLVELGATRVALLLDDIPDHLQHPGDLNCFPDLASAHSAVANRLHDQLVAEGVGLAVCPTTYWGRGDEEYLCRLGAALDPRIDLFWTGRAICSPAITAAEAVLFSRSANRPPLYWDNYPVNDVAMVDEMHVGPYRGRDALLHRFSAGVMANAMEYPEASKIALATVADYLWDPAGYNPERSLHDAVTQVAGPEDAQALAAFVDVSLGSCLSEPDPPQLSRAMESFRFNVRYGDPRAAGRELARVAAGIGEAASRLLSDDVSNLGLQQELRPWLEKFAVGAQAVAAISRLWPPGQPMSVADRQSVTRLKDLLESNPVRVFGDAIDSFLVDLIADPKHQEFAE